MILVGGATSDLGTAICRRLRDTVAEYAHYVRLTESLYSSVRFDADHSLCSPHSANSTSIQRRIQP
jgi:hypothetical protein